MIFPLLVHYPEVPSLHQDLSTNPGVTVVRMWVQLKRWCELVSTLCKYDLRKGELFVLWSNVTSTIFGCVFMVSLVMSVCISSLVLYILQGLVWIVCKLFCQGWAWGCYLVFMCLLWVWLHVFFGWNFQVCMVMPSLYEVSCSVFLSCCCCRPHLSIDNGGRVWHPFLGTPAEWSLPFIQPTSKVEAVHKSVILRCVFI